jgi:hypothetical protein
VLPNGNNNKTPIKGIINKHKIIIEF